MTEYWVSQGNKWCDICKIYISNNPSSIRNHDLGQRHKENVEKRLDTMRKESAAKEKEKKDAAKALEQIEAKAKRSYQKDVASFEAGDSNSRSIDDEEGWSYDSSSCYYYNQHNGLCYDPKSGFYYSDAIGNATGKWVTREEAYSKVQASSNRQSVGPSLKKPFPSYGVSSIADTKSQNETAPGPVISASLNPKRSVKGASSSVAIKRKRQDEKKPKAISKEEEAAVKAREAAKKRVEQREKPLLGLYNGSS